MTRKLWLFVVFVFFVVVISNTYAYERNGVTTTTWQVHDNRYMSATIQSAFDPDGTMKYNSAGGTSLVSGAIYIGEHNDEITIQIKIPTLGSTGIDVHIEGIFGSDANKTLRPSPQSTASWSDIYTESFTGTTATNYDFIIPLSEGPSLKWIRVGCKSTGSDSTDSITIWLKGAGHRW